MKKKQILIILLLIINGLLFAQSKVSYESIAHKEIKIEPNNLESLMELKTNISSFIGHGLDSLDVEIFNNGPMLSSILMSLVPDKDKPLTYQDVLNKILEIKKKDFYPQIRKATKTSKELENRTADIKNWDEEKKLLTQLEMPEEIMAEFKTYLSNNSDSNKTYKDVLTEFSSLYKKVQTISLDEFKSVFKHDGVINLNELITRSANEKKPLLFYFTGYACVNCRKMEDSLLNQKEIFTKLRDDFIFVNVYVDDKQELPKDQWFTSKATGKEIKTVGNKNSNFQVIKFGANSQPYFAIMNSKEEILNTTSYTREIAEFLDFLSQGLEKQ